MSTHRRARQACQSCNARRVKCDAVVQMPCSNCAQANLSCELRVSRRGKHPRRSSIRNLSDALSPPPAATAPESTDLVTSGPHLADEQVAASEVLAALSQAPRLAIQDRQHTSSEIANNTPRFTDGPDTVSIPAEGPNETDSPSQRTGREEEASVGREEEASVFLGESTSLQYFNDHSPVRTGPSPSQSLRFLHSVPNAVKAENLVPQWEADRKRARINYLRTEGAFSFPPKPGVETLLKAYFRWFHPCFPVVDEASTWLQYHEDTLSPLLLQAILFNAIVHCDEADLALVGLGPRHVARYALYNRAKDIFDVGFEPKRLTVIQALFLMSFWRTGALLEKDTRHWLGAALSQAQTSGLHRSSQSSDPRTDKLRRRLWWSIYIRERQCAAALGLPIRIRDEDCDVEPLNRSDFDHAFESGTPSNLVNSYAVYLIGMAYLSQVLGSIIHSGYLPGRTLTSADRTRIRDDLVCWRRGLPDNDQLSSDMLYSRPDFLSNMLHLAWNNLFILLYRAGCVAPDQGINGEEAFQAATRNSRIVEDMLQDDQVRHAQIHVITNLFNTLCIHTVSLRTAKGGQRLVAEHRAKLCLLGLQELQETWEVRNWILQLFFQYLDRPTAARLRDPTENRDSSAAMGSGRMDVAVDHAQSPRQSTVMMDEMGNLEDFLACDPPWTWATQEAHQLLFSRIEDEIQNDFAFGEGGAPLWSFEEP